MKIKSKKLNPNARFPEYQTPGSAGADVFACLPLMGLQIDAGTTAVIPTGIAVDIPEGHELQIRSRSGMTIQDALVVFNSPGTIDSDYRGEIFVILRNFSSKPVFIQNGDRIAQVVLTNVWKAEFDEDYVAPTWRNKKGLGSTGK